MQVLQPRNGTNGHHSTIPGLQHGYSFETFAGWLTDFWTESGLGKKVGEWPDEPTTHLIYEALDGASLDQFHAYATERGRFAKIARPRILIHYAQAVAKNKQHWAAAESKSAEAEVGGAYCVQCGNMYDPRAGCRCTKGRRN